MHHHVANAGSPWYTSLALIGWVAVGVAMVFGIATIVMWKWGIPRRLVVYSAEITPLVVSGPRVPQLKIFYEDLHVPEPTLVSLRIASRSRRDIGSADFDAGKPLVFNIGAEVIATLHGKGDVAAGKTFALQKRALSITPQKIRKGELVRLDFLTDGEPLLSVENPLLDITVKEVDPNEPLGSQDAALWRRLALLAAGLAAIFGAWSVTAAGDLGTAQTVTVVAIASAFVVVVAALGLTEDLRRGRKPSGHTRPRARRQSAS